MQSRTALGRDLVRTVIGWRLEECLLFLPAGDPGDGTELDAAFSVARSRLIDRITDVAYGAPPLTADEAEAMLAPAAFAIAAALGEGRTTPDAARRERVERAGLVGLIRAVAPAAARFCTEPRREAFGLAETLRDIVAEGDLRLDDVDDDVRREFLRRTSTPQAYRSRILAAMERTLDAKTLLAEVTSAFRREFTEPKEFAEVATAYGLDYVEQFVADVEDFRAQRCEDHIDEAIGDVWPLFA